MSTEPNRNDSLPGFYQMPLLEHLAELRNRVAVAGGGAMITAVACFFYATELFAYLTGPLRAAAANADFIGTGPAEAFIVKMKVAIVAGVILSAPLTFFEIWRFIAPGLHEHEKRFAAPFVIISSLFFFSGVMFCFYLVLPVAFDFFQAEYESIGVKASIKIGEYLSFVVKLLLVFGVVFEIPILSFFLARLGILTHTWLLKQARMAIVLIFIAAALLTPPDVVSQLLLALPLCVIYLLSIGICYYVAKASAVATPPDGGPPAPSSNSGST